MILIRKYIQKIRDYDLNKSIIINLATKPVSMFISLLYTPILLKFLGQESYGVWATILSIINWINYFDIGIGNGIRNNLTSQLTKKDFKSAKETVSTGYVALLIITITLCVIGNLIILFLDWNAILNTHLNVTVPLHISFTFICINFLLQLIRVEFYSCQIAELVSITQLIIQFLNLIGVIIFIHSNIVDNYIIIISILFGLSTFFIYLIASALTWKKADYLKPSGRLFDKSKLKSICTLGFKFFIIQIASLILFTTDSLILSHLFTPNSVTPYNTAYKAFGVFSSFFNAILAPFWSKFTQAQVNMDYQWIKKTLRQMKKIWGGTSIFILVIVPFFPAISEIWLGTKLDYTIGLIPAMAVYYILFMYSGICSAALNGLSEVDIQLKLSVLIAILNIPLSIFFAKNMSLGPTGVCLGTIVCLLINNIYFTLKMKKIYIIS